MNDQIIQQCAVMTDRELVRTLTIDRENFQETFLGIAESEREKRALSIENFIDNVHLAQNDEADEPCTIDQALAKVHSDIPLWSILTITNCLEDAWVIQREVSRVARSPLCRRGLRNVVFFLKPQNSCSQRSGVFYLSNRGLLTYRITSIPGSPFSNRDPLRF